MNLNDNEPCYVIGAAARIIGVHVQTLRYYEREGIIQPSRSRGNQRLYSPQDIARIRQIKTLVDDLGVNLAGVEIILRLTHRITEMEQKLQELQAELEPTDDSR